MKPWVVAATKENPGTYRTPSRGLPQPSWDIDEASLSGMTKKERKAYFKKLKEDYYSGKT